MGYNYGTVGVATVTSASYQLVAAETGANIASSAVRVFDAALMNTSCSISLYAGASASTASLILYLDKNNMYVHSDVGFRFIGGVYSTAVTATPSGSTASCIGTVNYIKEF